MAGPVTREKLNGEVWSSDNVGDSANLLRPDAATIAEGYKPPGVKPTRKYFNWLTNALASNIAFFENEGFYNWDSSISYEIGAIAIGSDNVRYRSKTASNLNNDPTTSSTNWEPDIYWLLPGLKNPDRALFLRDTDNTISLLGPASYFISSLNKHVGISGIIEYTLTSLTANTWTYIYIDKSTITGNTITASNLRDTTTPPAVYNYNKGGFYDSDDSGEDLCIFAVFGLTSSTYLGFYQERDFVTISDDPNFGQTISSLSSGVWTGAITLQAPSFVKRIGATMQLKRLTGAPVLFFRPHNVATFARRITSTINITGSESEVPFNELYTTSSQEVNFTLGTSVTSTADLDLYVYSWFFPEGM